MSDFGTADALPSVWLDGVGCFTKAWVVFRRLSCGISTGSAKASKVGFSSYAATISVISVVASMTAEPLASAEIAVTSSTAGADASSEI